MNYTAKEITVNDVSKNIKREIRENGEMLSAANALAEITNGTEKFTYVSFDDDVMWFHGDEPLDDITYHVDGDAVLDALKAIGILPVDEE